MKENAGYFKQQLAQSEVRLKELKKQGVKALSRYDIEIAHRGNAEQALRTAVMLVSNHIRYYKEHLKQGNEQLQLF